MVVRTKNSLAPEGAFVKASKLGFGCGDLLSNALSGKITLHAEFP
jgi:hypothetical protein